MSEDTKFCYGEEQVIPKERTSDNCIDVVFCEALILKKFFKYINFYNDIIYMEFDCCSTNNAKIIFQCISDDKTSWIRMVIDTKKTNYYHADSGMIFRIILYELINILNKIPDNAKVNMFIDNKNSNVLKIRNDDNVIAETKSIVIEPLKRSIPTPIVRRGVKYVIGLDCYISYVNFFVIILLL
jgi:hypothetical protein